MSRSSLVAIVPLAIAAALLAAVAWSAPSAGGSVAGQATPGVARDVPDASECRVEPRSLASLQVLATPTPGLPTPTPPTGSPPALPAGDPLDDATLAEITATARQLVACDNAGERLRGLALYSDAYLRQLFGVPGIFTPDRYAMLASPRPVDPAAHLALVEVRDARRLADGRAGAVVVVDDPVDPAGQRLSAAFIIFVPDGERWLIDGAIDLGPVAATPAP